MKRINSKQIESVLALPAAERFTHFVKTIVAWEEVWGLYEGGWALAATDEGQPVFPIWPAKEYALLCAQGEWSGYEPVSINLCEFTDDLLPSLKNDGVLPGIFYTPKNQGITMPVEEIIKAITAELERY